MTDEYFGENNEGKFVIASALLWIGLFSLVTIAIISLC